MLGSTRHGTAQTMAALRILVVDDNADIRVLVTFVLSRDPAFVLVEEAENGESALAFVRQHRPDVVVMDLLMPLVGGLAATRQIKSESPGTKVLVLTSLNDNETISSAFVNGADFFLDKRDIATRLASAIRAAMRAA
jgi:two-component system, NarL family, response regulator LiaR